MKKFKNSFGYALKCTLFSIFLLSIIFLAVSLLWVALTSYTLEEYNVVLCLVLKNAGGYSTLLVGIIVTVFFQAYSKERELEKEDRVKVEEIGYYTLAFKREEDEYREDFHYEKMVVEINDENDYLISELKENHLRCMIKFLTSKSKSTNLKNIMAFGDDYFERHLKDILDNYYEYCEKINYVSPLYCSTKPTCELENNTMADRTRYFWLVLRKNGNEEIKCFWISAVTEEGILLFIKVKLKIKNCSREVKVSLLQQSTYYKSQNRLCPLYR